MSDLPTLPAPSAPVSPALPAGHSVPYSDELIAGIIGQIAANDQVAASVATVAASVAKLGAQLNPVPSLTPVPEAPAAS